MDDMHIDEARAAVAAVERGDLFEYAAAGASSEEAHAWAAGVEYGLRAAAAVQAADAGAADATAVPRKAGAHIHAGCPLDCTA